MKTVLEDFLLDKRSNKPCNNIDCIYASRNDLYLTVLVSLYESERSPHTSFSEGAILILCKAADNSNPANSKGANFSIVDAGISLPINSITLKMCFSSCSSIIKFFIIASQKTPNGLFML